MHEFIVVERLPECRIAVFETEYPPADVTNEIDIGPLFSLFSESARKTRARETGEPGDEDAIDVWMGPTRFHLPPTIRWICRLGLVNGAPGKESLQVWMAVGDRVELGEHADVRTWPGGTYASVESGFGTTVSESWRELQRLLARHGLTAVGDEALVENFQATNHGGWDRYRIMVEVDEKPMKELGWRIS